MPSIVSITNKSVQEVQNYFSMFGYGGQAQEVESTSVGSGIIIGKNDTELLIVTNNHVVEGADTFLQASLTTPFMKQPSRVQIPTTTWQSSPFRFPAFPMIQCPRSQWLQWAIPIP